MAKARDFICHGPHRIMKTQVQVPKGWKLVRRTGAGGAEMLCWYCPPCLKAMSAQSTGPAPKEKP